MGGVRKDSDVSVGNVESKDVPIYNKEREIVCVCVCVCKEIPL